ncbi:hypothetical protein KY290_027081 [Solanum tuberosum]|uniref:Uncharacterized protein n=1 Tax=Solanum tuberosum TaxID=4113 RepID=A0ABQ7UFM4_SOLTU|nr:hypothetical protein KY284_026044 [Solanum tuberosum]KAH0747849.1 hypothetical protein KY290_027081 [Solanum tuberosum]
MMSDAIDDAIDDDETEEETEDLTNQVLDKLELMLPHSCQQLPRAKFLEKGLRNQAGRT